MGSLCYFVFVEEFVKKSRRKSIASKLSKLTNESRRMQFFSHGFQPVDVICRFLVWQAPIQVCFMQFSEWRAFRWLCQRIYSSCRNIFRFHRICVVDTISPINLNPDLKVGAKIMSLFRAYLDGHRTEVLSSL
jgi:hypothetical protein